MYKQQGISINIKSNINIKILFFFTKPNIYLQYNFCTYNIYTKIKKKLLKGKIYI